jgi:hypothetical protein
MNFADFLREADGAIMIGAKEELGPAPLSSLLATGARLFLSGP